MIKLVMNMNDGSVETRFLDNSDFYEEDGYLVYFIEGQKRYMQLKFISFYFYEE